MLLFSSNNPAVTLTTSACSYENQPVPTTINPSGTTQVIPDTQVSGNAEFTCSVDVTVTTAHAQGAEVPPFSIIAEYMGTDVTKAFYIETISAVPPVPVFTEATLNTPITEVVDAANTFEQGRRAVAAM